MKKANVAVVRQSLLGQIEQFVLLFCFEDTVTTQQLIYRGGKIIEANEAYHPSVLFNEALPRTLSIGLSVEGIATPFEAQKAALDIASSIDVEITHLTVIKTVIGDDRNEAEKEFTVLADAIDILLTQMNDLLRLRES